MTVKAVVLDMDGLMLDTEPLYKAAWQCASAELGYELDDACYATLTGRRTEEGEQALLGHFGPGFPLQRFRSRWPALWRERVMTEGIPRKPGLLEFLAFLEERTLPVAVATSSDAAYTEFSLRQAGLDRRLGVVVTGDQVARGKPAPDIYLEAARQLRVEPSACVALEDSTAGILAARAAGMVALLIPDWAAPSDDAVHAASHVLRSLHEAPHVVANLIAESGG